MTKPATFTCPDCGARSRHPQDIRYHYCGRCHGFKEPALFATGTTLSPFRKGRVWIAGRQCDSCFFRPENADGTVIGPMLRNAIHGDEPLVPCRETYEGPRAVCRTVYDLYGDTITMLYIAKIAGLIDFTDDTADQT